VTDYVRSKKHGEATAVNLTGNSGRVHISFYLDRERVLRFSLSGVLLGRLP
jgi:hypothetical protein